MSRFIILTLFLFSCASKKEVIQGYDGKKLKSALQKIQGKNPKEILKLLGRPALHGICYNCGQKKVYRIIYLKKDFAKFYLDLSYNTDMEVDCFVLDLMEDKKRHSYFFDRALGFYEAKNCNQKDGLLMEMKQILDI
jgi:hypothetical protein